MFTNQSNLDHHLGSALHKPRTIKCIGRGCTKKFISISGLILHAESGSCPARITRKLVNEYAVRVDQKNIITNPGRLITDDYGALSAPFEIDYIATSRSWNGRAYECFLCNKTFRTLDALNMHLQSPRHAEKIYRCPMKACETEFCALSALIQHVEWGSCGVRRNREVKKVMDSLTRNMRQIA